MKVLQLGGDSQMNTLEFTGRMCVWASEGGESGTPPPAPLINKFMYEGERKKRLLEGFQCHPSLPPAISLLQLQAAEQNYFPPVNNKEVYET